MVTQRLQKRYEDIIACDENQKKPKQVSFSVSWAILYTSVDDCGLSIIVESALHLYLYI